MTIQFEFRLQTLNYHIQDILGRSVSHEWNKAILFRKLCPPIHNSVLRSNHYSWFQNCGLQRTQMLETTFMKAASPNSVLAK